MALITRIGASNANSYVTLDQAEQILSRLPDDLTSWNELTTTEKEYRLILAARLVGQLPLRGKRVYKYQALAFPRTIREPQATWPYAYQRNLYTGSRRYQDIQGDLWRDETACRRVPDEVKQAQCQIAYSVVHRALANRGAVTDQTGSMVTSVSLGGALSVSFAPGGVRAGNLLDLIMSSLQAPIFLSMQNWLSQFRGGAVSSVEDGDYWEPVEALPTTTTTSSTTTTSTSTSTTTTTAP